jgi:hypothetical protein
VATSDGSKRIDPADGTDATVRRARTAAEQREARSSGSEDPDVLVEEIERTREDLAETLDAIADKVSPKRVAARTKQQVTETVKDGAAEASATVKEKAADASAAMSAGAASLKSTAEHVKETVQEKISGHGSTTPAASTPGALADAGDLAAPATTAALDPAGAEIPPLPALGTAPASGSVTTYGASPAVPKELLAGAGAALAVLLLLLRRRKRR